MKTRHGIYVTKCSFMQPIQFFTMNQTLNSDAIWRNSNENETLKHYEGIIKAEFGPKR